MVEAENSADSDQTPQNAAPDHGLHFANSYM